MAQVCLLNSNRLSQLLNEALAWDGDVYSLMVSATNGSILAYAFRESTPSIKALRTLSTTMTAAYTVASEDVLVFEAQNTSTISVIAPIADHFLLAVTGPEANNASFNHDSTSHDTIEARNGSEVINAHPPEAGHSTGLQDQANTRAQLEVVSQELAGMLKQELSGMTWPEDI